MNLRDTLSAITRPFSSKREPLENLGPEDIVIVCVLVMNY